MSIKISRQKYDLSRFWELFRPNTNTFSFWLATAAFCFFAYQSLYKGVIWGVWGIMIHQVLAWAFEIFGIICVAVIFYLFITWIFGISITKKDKELQDT